MVREPALTETISEIVSRIGERDWFGLDQMLHGLDPHEASAAHCIAMVRTTFAVRQKLPAWNGAVAKIKSSFGARGLNGNLLLKGLLT